MYNEVVGAKAYGAYRNQSPIVVRGMASEGGGRAMVTGGVVEEGLLHMDPLFRIMAKLEGKGPAVGVIASTQPDEPGTPFDRLQREMGNWDEKTAANAQKLIKFLKEDIGPEGEEQ